MATDGLTLMVPLIGDGVAALELAVDLKGLIEADVMGGLGGSDLAQGFVYGQTDGIGGDASAAVADLAGIGACVIGGDTCEVEGGAGSTGDGVAIVKPLVIEPGCICGDCKAGATIGTDRFAHRLLGEAEIRGNIHVEVAGGTIATATLWRDTDGSAVGGELNGDAVGSGTTGNGCACR